MPSKNKGGQNPRGRAGSRAMVETIAVTDGELTALSALSGQQLSSTEIESLASIQAELDRLNAAHGAQEVEDAVCVTVPPADSMEVEDGGVIHDSTTLTSAVVVDSTTPGGVVRATPLVHPSPSPSTSYVVIQSSPGNRVLTTNANAQAKKGPHIVSKLSSGSPQIQQVHLKTSTSSAAGPPPLVSRGTTFTVSGVRPLTPQSAGSGSRPQMVTKVLLPRQGGPQVMAIPVQDSKTDQHRIVTLGGQHVKVLSGGMKVATITQQDSLDGPERAVSASPVRPIVVQTRPPTKVQQILPTSPVSKSIVVNRVLPGSGTRVTVIPQGAKSPAKILPAPTTTTVTTTSSQVSVSPQKVIIRQTPLKPMTSSGQQVLRISSSAQPTSVASSSFQSVQVAGRTMQYVRLVSIPSSANTTTTVSSAGVGKGNAVLTLASTPVSHPQISGVKMIPIAPVVSQRPVAAKSVSQKIVIPASMSMTQIRAPVPTSVISSTTVAPSVDSFNSSNIVMLSTAAAQASRNKIIQQAETEATSTSAQDPLVVTSTTPKTPSTSASQVSSKPKLQKQIKVERDQEVQEKPESQQTGKLMTDPVLTPAVLKPASGAKSSSEPNGIRPRKPCNCTKSQCLKLYCDCFANGEFCYQCNCHCCFNNLEHEEDRQRAIRSCLERNPNAFRPKIGKGQIGDCRRHNKGCNCKRSGCLKNYCECYEAKISCSANCKCVGCRNIEEDLDKRSLRDLMEVAERENRVIQSLIPKKKPPPPNPEIKQEPMSTLVTSAVTSAASRTPTPTFLDIGTSTTSSFIDEEDEEEEEPPLKTLRRPVNVMTDEVIDATCECLLAAAERAEYNNLREEDTEKLIIEEFGRCLVEIIASVTNRTDEVSSVCE